jgi:DNA repair protein RadC
MTLHELFGEGGSQKTRSIRFKTIRPVWQTLTVKDVVTDYIGPRSRITTSREVYELFHFLGQETKEHFMALHLDSKNRILCIDHVSSGSLNASIVHPREVFKGCLLSSAAAVILLHNHPSGDPVASREDAELTSRLKEAGELLGIRVLDHVIIGNGCYISLADRGLLS